MKRNCAYAAAWLVALGIIGCGGNTYEVKGTNQAVGADATLDLEALDGGNTMVTLDAEFLPPPQRLGDGLTTYVMWFVPKDAPSAQKVAIVAYDPDGRTGHAQATTVADQFEVRVTAEKNANVATPSENLVFKQKIKLDR